MITEQNKANGLQYNAFDICQAWYVYAMEYHKGQFSPEYRIFGRLQNVRFRPGIIRTNKDYKRSMSHNARAILASLIRRDRNKQQIIRGNGYGVNPKG